MRRVVVMARRLMRGIVVLVTALLTTGVSANSDADKNFVYSFLKDYNGVVSYLADDYKSNSESKVSVKAVNVNDRAAMMFLEGSTHRKYTDYFLAMQYYPNLNYNGEDTGFCFIIYDDRNRVKLLNYIKYFGDNGAAINYLALHEFAHCLKAQVDEDVKQNNDDLLIMNEKDAEAFADSFAYAFIAKTAKVSGSKEYADLRDKIFSFILSNKESDIHNNKDLGIIFKEYYDLNEGALPEKSSTKDILEFVLVFFKNRG